MCMAIREHFITIKIFPGGQPGGGKGKGTGAAVPCLPISGSAHAVGAGRLGQVLIGACRLSGVLFICNEDERTGRSSRVMDKL